MTEAERLCIGLCLLYVAGVLSGILLMLLIEAFKKFL